MTTTGPFIVTHREPGSPAITNSASGEPGEPDALLYREAFATLEEARMIAESLTDHRDDWREWRKSIAALPESGGSISLLDGSVIEIEATTYDELRSLMVGNCGGDDTIPNGEEKELIFAAWNAEHGIGPEARA